jgi:hypothetical protein
VQDPLALELLQGAIGDGDHVVAERRGESISFAVAPTENSS